MHVIGIRLISLEQLQPRAARAEEHGEREADLRLRQILAQTIPGPCVPVSTRSVESRGGGKPPQTSAKGDEVAHQVRVDVAEPALRDEVEGVFVHGRVAVHEVPRHAHGRLQWL